MTYSIVARDARSGALGVGVQSHFFGAGHVVTWAEAGVGAIATQASSEIDHGPRGLQLMRSGRSADQVLGALMAVDGDAEIRQVGIVDREGRSAAHTGGLCVPEAGHALVDGVSTQANMMVRPGVPEAMLTAFSNSVADLPERLLTALEAAEVAGGDIRGRQSAALLVVSGIRSDQPWKEVLFDIRVDDHPEPLVELRRLLVYRRAYNMLERVLAIPGVVRGTLDLDGEGIEAAVADLRRAQRLVGDNPEPTLWRGVLLARAGRADSARACFDWAASLNPALTELVRRLVAAGILPNEFG